jgi:hypothetical protein
MCAGLTNAHLVSTLSCDRLFSMSGNPEKERKGINVSDLFPDLPEQQLNEVRETLDDYCGLLLQIFERLERERDRDFDGECHGS